MNSKITRKKNAGTSYTLTLFGLTPGALRALASALTVWGYGSTLAVEILHFIRYGEMPAGDLDVVRALDPAQCSDWIPADPKTLVRYEALRAHLSSNGGMTEAEIDEIADCQK